MTQIVDADVLVQDGTVRHAMQFRGQRALQVMNYGRH
jgi:hypothetical protein